VGTCRVQIVNRLGLHARAATKFVEMAASFPCEIEVSRGEKRIDGKSIMGVMMLAATQGTVIEITVHGPEEEMVLRDLVALVRDGFGER